MPYALIPTITTIAVLLLLFSKEKTEKNLSYEGVVRTRLSKKMMIFFLAFALIGTCGGTVLGIIYRNNKIELLCIVVAFSFFAIIGWIGYAYGRFTYVIADSDTIIVHRLFRETKTYSYEEIAYFRDTTRSGVQGELTCYDQNNKKMFSIETMFVGVSLIARRLKEKNIVQKL